MRAMFAAVSVNDKCKANSSSVATVFSPTFLSLSPSRLIGVVCLSFLLDLWPFLTISCAFTGQVSVQLLGHRAESFSDVKRVETSVFSVWCFYLCYFSSFSPTPYICFFSSWFLLPVFFPFPVYSKSVIICRCSLALGLSVTPHQSLACSPALSSWSITLPSLVDREMLFSMCVCVRS